MIGGQVFVIASIDHGFEHHSRAAAVSALGVVVFRETSTEFLVFDGFTTDERLGNANRHLRIVRIPELSGRAILDKSFYRWKSPDNVLRLLPFEMSPQCITNG